MAQTNVQAFSGDVELNDRLTINSSVGNIVKKSFTNYNNNASTKYWKVATGNYNSAPRNHVKMNVNTHRVDGVNITRRLVMKADLDNLTFNPCIDEHEPGSSAHDLRVYKNTSTTTFDIYLQIESYSYVDVEISFSGSGITVFDTPTWETSAPTTSATYILEFTNGNLNAMRITNDGNVGIGKTNPGTALDVVGIVTATTFSGALSGNSTTATSAATLTTARTIGGVSFNGGANITLPGVNAAGNQNTSGNAGTVSNGVYTSGDQTIGGNKVFSSRITLGTSASIRQSSTGAWTGDPGSGVGKLEYHSNRWYIVAGSNSTTLLQIRRNDTDKFTIDNNGSVSLGSVPWARLTGVQTLTRGSYLTGDNYNGGTARTFAVDATTTNTASKIVARDSNGDIYARYVNGEYMNMSHGASARNSDTVFYSSTDNYIRKTTASGMRSSLNVPTRTGEDASGSWGINITGSAATAGTATNQSGGTVSATTITSSGIITCNANKMVIAGDSPTLYLRDSDSRTGMIHQNDNRMYFLSGPANSDVWNITANIRWPLYIDTSTNQAVFGGNIDATVGTVSAAAFSGGTVSGTNGTFSGAGPIIDCTAADPGDMISKRYASADRYGMGQYALGATRLFTSTAYGAATIRLSGATNDVRTGAATFNDYMTVKTNGNVGIGTVSPAVKLHVEGSSSQSAPTGNYFSDGTGGIGQANYNTQNFDISIYASTAIHCTTKFIASSDRRIKKDIIDANDSEALDTLRLLKPKKYKYKDSVQQGEEPVWGFIAQEVRDVLSYSTGLVEHVIPNIYELAEVSGTNVITFTTFDTSELESNATTIKITSIDNNEVEVTIVDVIDDHTIRVVENLDKWTGSIDENGNVITEITSTTLTVEEYEALESKERCVANISRYQNANVFISVVEYQALEDTTGYTEVIEDYTQTKTIYPGNKIFVFGQKVNDFLTLNKAAIWTVATAALQEVDRQLQAEKAKVADLLARVTALENKETSNIA